MITLLIDKPVPVVVFDSWISPEEVPQNQRLLRSTIEKAKSYQALSFEAGDAHYGEKLAAITLLRDGGSWPDEQLPMPGRRRHMRLRRLAQELIG